MESVAQLLALILTEAWGGDDNDEEPEKIKYPAGHPALKMHPRDSRLAANHITALGSDIGRLVGFRPVISVVTTGFQPPLFEVTITGRMPDITGGSTRFVIRGHAKQRRFDFHYVLPPGHSKDPAFVKKLELKRILDFHNTPPDRESFRTASEHEQAYKEWSQERSQGMLMARIRKLMKKSFFRGWKLRNAFWESSSHFNKHYIAPYGKLKR